ncbi:MAG: hypothetical protein RBT25_05610 [Lentisphaeria bacterium]|nr:hypothetical protein [Lentisphaeria bacterium]
MFCIYSGEKPSLLKVVNDQGSNPSSTLTMARALKNLIEIPELVGTFH